MARSALARYYLGLGLTMVAVLGTAVVLLTLRLPNSLALVAALVVLILMSGQLLRVTCPHCGMEVGSPKRRPRFGAKREGLSETLWQAVRSAGGTRDVPPGVKCRHCGGSLTGSING